MRHALLVLLCSLGLAATLPGCDAINYLAQRQALAKTEFKFDHVALQSADVPFLTQDAKANMQVFLNVSNPNPITAVLDRFDYQLFMDGTQVATGHTAEQFSVDAGATKSLVLPVSIPYLGLPAPIIQAITNRKATFNLKGISHLTTPIGVLDIPVDLSKETTF